MEQQHYLRIQQDPNFQELVAKRQRFAWTLSMFWSRLTTRGAVYGGWLGLLSAVSLMILSPTLWVKVLGHAEAIFPYEYPALFSMALAFVGVWFCSVTDKSQNASDEQAKCFPQCVRSQTGLGASGASAH